MDPEVKESIRKNLRISSGWCQFVAIVLFLAAALILIGGLIALVGAGGGFGLMIFVIGGVCAYMGSLVLQYANAIKSTSETGDLQRMEPGIEKLRTFFIISCIITAIQLIISLGGLAS